MSFAISALAPRLNAEALVVPPLTDTHPVKVGSHDAQAGLLNPLGDGWCGTVPKHFPIPLPKGGSDDGGWCGTVPHKFPFPVPPVPPQPWQDLGAAAQAFR